ncbi:MAG: response regulator transcription factor [Rubrivivax sp.]|nr:response regulator transcription factor [Rubrivivax sp.]
MTTALIAEDEALLAESLRRQLLELWPGLQLLPLLPDGHAALEAALALRPQVCFLDIRMPGLSGLEVAAALAEDWPDDRPFPLLVFVTAYDQYAVQAFDAQAVDYLVKPVQRERLASCVQRLQARLEAGTPALAPTLEQLRALLLPGAPAAAPRLDMIPVQTGAVVRFVPVDEVLYFEAADKYVRVVTAAGEHLIRTSLRELLPQLDPQRFWQVHRGTVVQLRAVASARREESGRCTLSLHGRAEKLVVSRLYAHLFRGL